MDFQFLRSMISSVTNSSSREPREGNVEEEGVPESKQGSQGSDARDDSVPSLPSNNPISNQPNVPQAESNQTANLPILSGILSAAEPETGTISFSPNESTSVPVVPGQMVFSSDQLKTFKIDTSHLPRDHPLLQHESMAVQLVPMKMSPNQVIPDLSAAHNTVHSIRPSEEASQKVAQDVLTTNKLGQIQAAIQQLQSAKMNPNAKATSGIAVPQAVPDQLVSDQAPGNTAPDQVAPNQSTSQMFMPDLSAFNASVLECAPGGDLNALREIVEQFSDAFRLAEIAAHSDNTNDANLSSGVPLTMKAVEGALATFEDSKECRAFLQHVKAAMESNLEVNPLGLFEVCQAIVDSVDPSRNSETTNKMGSSQDDTNLTTKESQVKSRGRLRHKRKADGSPGSKLPNSCGNTPPARFRSPVLPKNDVAAQLSQLCQFPPEVFQHIGQKYLKYIEKAVGENTKYIHSFSASIFD